MPHVPASAQPVERKGTTRPNLRPGGELTDEEEARIQAAIAADPEDPTHWGTEYRSAIEVAPELVKANQDGRILPHPLGRILKLALEGVGMSQRQLATAMGRPPNAISEIIRGRKSRTAKTVIELEHVLGVSARTWLHVEADYRLALERQRRKLEGRGGS